MKVSSKLLYKDVNKAITKRDRLFRKYSYENSKLIANNASPWEQREVVSKEFYGEGVDGVFEGISVKLPQNYDAYLSSVYGDYMKLPPEEERVGHHYYTVIDIDKTYKEYTK